MMLHIANDGFDVGQGGVRKRHSVILTLCFLLQLILAPEKSLADLSHSNVAKLYVGDSVSFLIDKVDLKMTITPDGCGKRDERTIELSSLDSTPTPPTGNYHSGSNVRHLYNLTQIDCYNFTLRYKQKKLTLRTYRHQEFPSYCDMSRFLFVLVGVSEVDYTRPNGVMPSTDEVKRCNFVRRGKLYPLDNKSFLDLKHSPVYMILYVLIGILVIGTLWLICFYFVYKMVKNQRTSLIRSQSDVFLTQLSDEETENHHQISVASSSAQPITATNASLLAAKHHGLPEAADHVTEDDQGHGKGQRNLMAVVELHQKDDQGLGKGQRNFKPSAPSIYPVKVDGCNEEPPPYQDVYNC